MDTNLKQYEELKSFLIDKWGEAADEFPGEFHIWLAQWIDTILQDEDPEFLSDIPMATTILVDEIESIESLKQ